MVTYRKLVKCGSDLPLTKETDLSNKKGSHHRCWWNSFAPFTIPPKVRNAFSATRDLDSTKDNEITVGTGARAAEN